MKTRPAIIRPVSCLDATGRVKMDALIGAIKEHRRIVPSLKKLQEFYDGEHAILKRLPRSKGLADNRLVDTYPRYITTMAAGYLIGSPVSYAIPDDGEDEAFKRLVDAYSKMNADAVDMEVAKDASIYGLGVEICYATNAAMPKVAAVNPTTAFVVYDDTVEHNPLFGVHYYKVVDEKGDDAGWRVCAYTNNTATEYTAPGTDAPGELTESLESAHYFGGVPVIEYWNNEERAGDFEPVMSLVDAYDSLQSDRINDKEQFVDALLAIYGVIIDDDDDEPGGKKVGQRLREEKVLQFPDPQARVEWLSKQLSEADVEILKNALNIDIHKMSMVPDLSDKEFAGNSSGVAMRYKMLGLEQLTKIKERWFRDGLMARLRLFANFFSVKGASVIDPEEVQITFTRSLPNNDVETAQMIETLQDIVPNQLLIKQLPFVDDVAKAMEMLAEEREEREKRQRAMFDDYPDTNREGTNNGDERDDVV